MDAAVPSIVPGARQARNAIPSPRSVRPPCPLCSQISTCPSGSTTISGKVFTGSSTDPDPVSNALVFVPNGDLSSLTDGAHCDRCSPLSLDQAIVNTLTAPDGSFKLSNVPAGDAIPIVVQLGNWRRRITLKIAPCVDNQVVDGTLRLSRSHSEGDIPLTAIATGYFDAPECVLLKMGLMDSEFSNPSGTGRIQLFTPNWKRYRQLHPVSR
jgi:hypothetical protein